MRRAAIAVMVMVTGCAFDPSGFAPRGGGAGGDAGELADQVLEGGRVSDAGDVADQVLVDHQVAGDGALADQVLVDARVLDAAPPIDAPWEGCRTSTECAPDRQGRSTCCYLTTTRGICVAGAEPVPGWCIPN